MKFTIPSINLLFFAGLSLALVARVTPKDVYSNYEDVVTSGLPLLRVVSLPLYKQLHYDGFQAVQQLPLLQLTVYPDGTGCALGINGSSLTSQYTGSPVSSFTPNYASFACYLSDRSSITPGISCTIQVTAFRLDGTEYPDRASCSYTGSGKVQACTFPDTWTQVGKLSFSVITSSLFTAITSILSGLLGPLLSPAPGTVRFMLDNFDSFYTCVAGKSNDPATGLCV